MKRKTWLLAGAAVLAAVTATGAVAVMSSAKQAIGVGDNGYPTSTATISEGSLSSQLSLDGTLQYTTPGGSSYSVINQASGTFSRLPRAGEVFSRGRVLYRVSNDPVILLYGNTPVYRSLSEGEMGPDMRELNENLLALGYATARRSRGIGATSVPRPPPRLSGCSPTSASRRRAR